MLTTEWNDEQARKVLRQEGVEEGIEKGIEKGVDVSAEIIRDLIAKVPIEEIAARFQVAVDKVKQLQSVLTQYSA